MRYVNILASVALITTASAAYAQSGAPVPLDEQLRRMQMEKPTAPHTRKTFPANPTYQPTTPSQARMVPHREIIDSEGGGAIPALPIMQMTENGVTYLSGGIGEEELDQIKAQQDHYSLHVTITGKTGAFASNVMLYLKDKSGKTLVTVPDAGPKVLYQLPAGQYTLEATDGRSTETLSVSVPSHGAAKRQIRI